MFSLAERSAIIDQCYYRESGLQLIGFFYDERGAYAGRLIAQRSGTSHIINTLADFEALVQQVRDESSQHSDLAQTPYCLSGKHKWCDSGGPDFTCVRCGFVFTYEPDEVSS